MLVKPFKILKQPSNVLIPMILSEVQTIVLCMLNHSYQVISWQQLVAQTPHA